MSGLGASLGAALVWLVGGDFYLGSSPEEMMAAATLANQRLTHPAYTMADFAWEQPQFVRLGDYGLDLREVSVGQYQQCVLLGACAEIEALRNSERELPARWVTQAEAQQYCLFQGKRLPSEGELEWAARRDAQGRQSSLLAGDGDNFGPFSSTARSPGGSLYQQGQPEPPRAAVRLVSSAPRPGRTHRILTVSQKPEELGPLGLSHLHGNVSEWTSSRGAAPEERIVKGGSYRLAPVWGRPQSRWSLPAETRAEDLGFRCAQDPKNAGGRRLSPGEDQANSRRGQPSGKGEKSP